MSNEQNITADGLILRGYKEYPPNKGMDSFYRAFQKAIDDDNGKRLYFINIRQWKHNHWESWDCQVCTDSDTGGYLWATMRENTIELMESRAEAMWKAAGAKPYDE